MRSTVLLIALGFAPSASAHASEALTFDDIVQRAAADPTLLARTAGLARLQRELSATGRYTREGPTLDAALGPRRLEDGSTGTEAAARLEFPLLSGGGARDAADSRLRDAGADILAAEAVESRLRLRAAYLDTWLHQAHLGVIDAQARATEQVVAAVRRRVEEGAEAPYELALVEGELLRSRSDSDVARSASGEAWAQLRALADLPPEPQELASPGMPQLEIPSDARLRFETGLLRQTVAQRAALETAFLDLERAQGRSRWSVAAEIGKEGHESFAIVGAGYRFPRRGESRAAEHERMASIAVLERVSEVEAARLATRFETALSRARRFGPITPPEALDDALRSVSLRMELGKDRPSQALAVRRQLLEANAAALQRVRDAHLLIAEFEALTSGDAP